MRCSAGSDTAHKLPASPRAVKRICRSAKRFRRLTAAGAAPTVQALPLRHNGALFPHAVPIREMNLQVRLHDAVDQETVLQRLLPVLAGDRGERRAAYAAYDAASGT